jgi:hypothetical protein
MTAPAGAIGKSGLGRAFQIIVPQIFERVVPSSIML